MKCCCFFNIPAQDWFTPKTTKMVASNTQWLLNWCARLPEWMCWILRQIQGFRKRKRRVSLTSTTDLVEYQDHMEGVLVNTSYTHPESTSRNCTTGERKYQHIGEMYTYIYGVPLVVTLTEMISSHCSVFSLHVVTHGLTEPRCLDGGWSHSTTITRRWGGVCDAFTAHLSAPAAVSLTARLLSSNRGPSFLTASRCRKPGMVWVCCTTCEMLAHANSRMSAQGLCNCTTQWHRRGPLPLSSHISLFLKYDTDVMMVLITSELSWVFKQVAAYFPKHTYTHIWKQANYGNSS